MPEPEWAIATMLSADLADVLEIERAERQGWTIKQFEEELARPEEIHYVARPRHMNRVVGFVCGRIAADEGEILKIGVHPDWRRRGVADALLVFTLDRMRRRSARQCFLELRASNLAALCLYKKLGFLRTGMRRGYYNDPAEDAVLMGREVESSS